MSAGDLHTCAVTGSGGVKCWGDNTHGQLGDGTTQSSLVPVDVVGLSDVVSVSAGVGHTCALTASGGGWCWGQDDSGQIGDGLARPATMTPQLVLSGVRAISAGYDHTCAVLLSGTALCWGANAHGQLGDGTTSTRGVPAPVETGSPFVAIAAGTFHALGITLAGEVLYWGDSSFGELGTYSPTVPPSLVPVPVAGAPVDPLNVGTAEVHSCTLAGGGAVDCWGANTFGDLGNGTLAGTSVPGAVLGPPGGALAISVGEDHTCALDLNGGAWCWGDNFFGQIGDGTTTMRTVPTPVVGLSSGVTSIATGWGGVFESWSVNGGNRHTCAAMARGGVQCWGSNDSGQLGNGTTAASAVPVDVLGF